MEQELINKKYIYYYLLIGIGIFIYFASLFNAFVWDDMPQILYNPAVHTLSNIPRLFMGGTFPPTNMNPLGAYYRPFVTMTYAFLFVVFGQQPFFFHALQLIMHIASAVLVFLLFKKFFSEKVAFFLALIFLVHPINVETVAYIGSIHVSSFLLFGMIALLLSMIEAISFKRYISISFFLLLSILCNETGALFFAAVMLYRLIFIKRKAWAMPRFLSMIGLSGAVYLFLRFGIARIFFPQTKLIPIMAVSFFQRLMTAPAVFFYYIKAFFVPLSSYIAQRWVVTSLNVQFYLPLLLDVLFLALSILGLIYVRSRRQSLFRPALFFLCWFLLGMLFHLQLYPLDMTVADRWFYFQEIGLLGFLGTLLLSIAYKKSFEPVAMALTIIIVSFLILQTCIQATYWQNELVLFSNSFAYIKGTKVENTYALALYNAGQYKEAQKHFLYLISKDPNEPSLYYNLALTYETEGNFAKAKTTYEHMVALDHEEKGYAALAKLVLVDDKQAKEAKEIAAEGLQRYPHSYYLWLVTAVAQYRLGDRDGALASAEKAKSVLDTNEIQGIISQMQQGQPL